MAYALFNQTRPEDLLTYVNEVTSGHFGWTMILVIWWVAFIGMSNLGSNKAFPSATFLTMVIAGLFGFLGLIQMVVLIIVGIFLVLSVIMLKSSKE